MPVCVSLSNPVEFFTLLEWTRGAGCASGEGRSDQPINLCTWCVPWMYLICTVRVPDMYPVYTWYVPDLYLICIRWTSITLLTQYHFFGRLFSRFFDYSSISLLQNRLEKKIRSSDGRADRFWPDLEAPWTTARTSKRLPVTARSFQKMTHKSLSNSLEKSTNRAPPALLLGHLRFSTVLAVLKAAPAAQ